MNKKKLEDIKELLIVVDMINGFTKEGAMASSNILHIIPEIQSLAKEFSDDEKKGLMFIKDVHDEDCLEFKRYPVHCRRNTSESEVVSELKEYENMALVHEKNSTSAIFSKDFLVNINKMKNLKKVVVTGCCTDICVINLAIPLRNYFDEHNKDIEIVVPENAVETYDSPTHPKDKWNEMAFEFMNAGGIKLVKKYGGR